MLNLYTHCLGSLREKQSYRISERPCLKKIRWIAIDWKATHVSMYASMRAHTQIARLSEKSKPISFIHKQSTHYDSPLP